MSPGPHVRCVHRVALVAVLENGGETEDQRPSVTWPRSPRPYWGWGRSQRNLPSARLGRRFLARPLWKLPGLLVTCKPRTARPPLLAALWSSTPRSSCPSPWLHADTVLSRPAGRLLPDSRHCPSCDEVPTSSGTVLAGRQPLCADVTKPRSVKRPRSEVFGAFGGCASVTAVSFLPAVITPQRPPGRPPPARAATHGPSLRLDFPAWLPAVTVLQLPFTRVGSRVTRVRSRSAVTVCVVKDRVKGSVSGPQGTWVSRVGRSLSLELREGSSSGFFLFTASGKRGL